MSQEYRNCIFANYCGQYKCDLSCPKNTMSELLLEKCDIPKQSVCYQTPSNITAKYSGLIADYSGSHITLEVKDPQLVSESVAYTGICNFCEKNGSKVSVYQLKYSKYIQMLKDSWSHGVGNSLLELQAFCNTAKLLVISSLDYVIYSDFECQTLLTLLQDRAKPGLTTVLVLSSIQSLVSKGSSPFYEMLKRQLEGGLRK